MQTKIKKIKDYAIKNNVPIIEDDTLIFLTNFIKEKNVKSILELGSAIGYSSICMASINQGISILTVERNIDRYNIAVNNINHVGLVNQIKIINNDALSIDIDNKFDLIFIDAAKGQNINFFNKYLKNLNRDGYIITDNMNFHGLVNDEPLNLSRNLRALLRKIKDYKKFLLEQENIEVEFLDIGDGLAIIRLK